MKPTYRYTLYGKERNIDTGIHAINCYITKIGAYIAKLRYNKTHTNLYIA